MLTALIFVVQSATPLVDGLRAGETAREIAVPAHAVLAPQVLRFGRVLDASTSAPLAGVTVEAWTENWERPAVLLDRATSAQDGAFVLRRERDGIEAEKVRIHCAGYRSTTSAFSDLGETLLVRAPAPMALTVLDLRGAPISGARYSTRQTCAHEPPAIDVRSDASGRCDLSTHPPLEDGPEGEVEAPGYEARRTLDTDGMFLLGNSEPEMYLGRKRPLRVRVLEPDGRPAANLRVVLGNAPEWLARTTDAEGRVVIDTLFAGSKMYLRVLEGSVEEWIVECCAWRDAELTVRRRGLADERAPVDGDATLSITCAEPGVPWLVLHEQGWRVERAGVAELPPGRCTLYYGADFSGWREGRVEFVLAAGENKELSIAPVREPRLVLKQIDSPPRELVVECAGHSMRYWVDKPKELPVPAGEPLTLVSVSERVATRLELGPIEHDTELAWSQFAAWRQPKPWSIALLPVPIEVPDALAGRVTGRVECPGQQRTERFPMGELGRAERLVPSHAPFELHLAAEGCVPRLFAVPWDGKESPLDGALREYATLRVSGASVRVLGPQGDAEHGESDGVFELTELAPGPLIVLIERGDRRWLELTLELASGELRELSVR